MFSGLIRGVPQFTRGFHAGTAAMVRQKHLRRLNRLHKHWARQLLVKEEKPVDPVFGKPRTPFILRLQAILAQPENQVDHISPEETSRLVYGASLAQGAAPAAVSSGEDAEKLAQLTSQMRGSEDQHKASVLSRIVSLQNSNHQQAQKQAVQLAVTEFQRFEGDTGSPEVQAAVATVRIHYVAAHAKENKKDSQSKRRLEHMVQTRRNTLLYLKRLDPKRYIWAVEKLGLSDESLKPEFHMSRGYLWSTQFYGDKTLPMKKTIRDTQKARKMASKMAKAEKYLAQHDPDALLRL